MSDCCECPHWQLPGGKIMAISITINGTVTLDESAALQTGGVATSTEDNNDSDFLLATLQSQAATFYNRLFGGGGLGLSTLLATSIGVAKSADDYISLSGTGSVISLNFTTSGGAALPTYSAGVDPATGAASGLSALNGGAIRLFSDLSGRAVVGVDEFELHDVAIRSLHDAASHHGTNSQLTSHASRIYLLAFVLRDSAPGHHAKFRQTREGSDHRLSDAVAEVLRVGVVVVERDYRERVDDSARRLRLRLRYNVSRIARVARVARAKCAPCRVRSYRRLPGVILTRTSVVGPSPQHDPGAAGR